MDTTHRAGGSLPLVGITCNLRVQEQHRFHSTSEKYSLAVREAAGAVPVLIPGLGPRLCCDTLLERLDGVVLTGGASNIEPHHYGQEPAPGEDLRDPGRDHVALELVRRAIARGVPLLGICRGIQEMNVALGGTLHQRLHQVPGHMDHRRPRWKPWAEQLAPRQLIRLSAGGRLARLFPDEFTVVNSLHGQGIDQLAASLQLEAVADDGAIEAVSVRDAEAFAVGVQWHAELGVHESALCTALFKAFGAAVAARAARRPAQPVAPAGALEEPA